MKLFVWNKPYHVPYGSSLLFVVAESLEQAKMIARTSPSFRYGEFSHMKGEISLKLGDPIRVKEIPCGEWHEWSE